MQGIIRGKTIELEEEPGFSEGQVVNVTIEAVLLPPGEGLPRSFGSWAADAEGVDRFVEWTYAQRETDRKA